MRKQVNELRKLADAAVRRGYDRSGTLKYLRDHGWRRLAGGGFSQVVHHPDYPELVIKVGCLYASRRGTREAGLNDGFPEYAKAIDRGWIKSVYAPRIWFTETNNQAVTVTVMEKLIPLRSRLAKRPYIQYQSMVQINAVIPEGRWLKPGARYVLEHCRQYGDLDLSGTNIMQRKNGQHVFSDPITIPA